MSVSNSYHEDKSKKEIKEVTTTYRSKIQNLLKILYRYIEEFTTQDESKDMIKLKRKINTLTV